MYSSEPKFKPVHSPASWRTEGTSIWWLVVPLLHPRSGKNGAHSSKLSCCPGLNLVLRADVQIPAKLPMVPEVRCGLQPVPPCHKIKLKKIKLGSSSEAFNTQESWRVRAGGRGESLAYQAAGNKRHQKLTQMLPSRFSQSDPIYKDQKGNKGNKPLLIPRAFPSL